MKTEAKMYIVGLIVGAIISGCMTWTFMENSYLSEDLIRGNAAISNCNKFFLTKGTIINCFYEKK